ncbi:hypothetical protein SNE40_002131 [Patella caerulea]|uniref:Interleukin 17-like protein n=1 Tax=Patella caerulea TaxID=87958 RepID=A0AAN8K6L2_PATCE
MLDFVYALPNFSMQTSNNSVKPHNDQKSSNIRYLFEDLDHDAKVLGSINSTIEVKSTPIKSTCPSEVGTEDSVWQRSICPWEYKAVYLGNDYDPPSYTEAVCICDRCIGLSNSRNRCESIKADVLVLKKEECILAKCSYKKIIIQGVTVGCTCAGPRT